MIYKVTSGEPPAPPARPVHLRIPFTRFPPIYGECETSGCVHRWVEPLYDGIGSDDGLGTRTSKVKFSTCGMFIVYAQP